MQNFDELLASRAAFSCAEAAQILGATEPAIRQRIRRGTLASTRVAGRILVPASVVRQAFGFEPVATQSTD